ncbi:MAG: aminoacyl-tRNA hydrolase [Alphaproteobacteria bacterium]|nr:aminoacyl-tRNA hydrolase [Alphaproteobacteria bacterium]
MQLFVGLGNPESKYAKNRHNIGFMAIDALAAAYGFGDFREKYHGLLAEGQIGTQKVLLLKPQTFMNKSGVSVSEAVNFFKLDGSQIIVFYDELDLPPGKLRMRRGGGFAGHNGLRSINAHMGADFRRARLGIGHPGDKAKVNSHVLGDFAKADADWLAAFLKTLADHAPLLAAGDDATYQTRVVEAMHPQEQADQEDENGI